MKFAFAIAFLFIGLVHSATISKEAFDKKAITTVDTLVNADAIETVDTLKSSLDTKKDAKREAIDTKKDSLDTMDVKKDSLTTAADVKRSFDMMSMDIPDGMNASQCIFKPEESLLTCKGPTDTIECPAVPVTGSWNKTKAHYVFGISVIPGNNSFWLYPRKHDNTTYRNHTVHNGTIDLQLWSGEAASNVHGLNVTDFACWTKLAKVITEGCKTPRMARVSSNWTNTVEEVGLCGEVLVLDKVTQKRWLYGYGWGLGAGLWGWGGYPYYGYWGPSMYGK